jgi:hypothetical protein
MVPFPTILWKLLRKDEGQEAAGARREILRRGDQERSDGVNLNQRFTLLMLFEKL